MNKWAYFSDKQGLDLPEIIGLVLLAILAFVGWKLYQAHVTYGTLQYVDDKIKYLGYGASAGFIALIFFMLTPYLPPASKDVALVLGNTQNTPAPQITDALQNSLGDTLLLHKGQEPEEFMQSITLISAVRKAEVADIDVESLKLKKIRNESSSAKLDVEHNLELLQEFINEFVPSSNGANYLEAIFEARSNLDPQPDANSSIVVIGSGLSDSGELDFANMGLLTKSDKRESVVDEIIEKYGRDYLKGYVVTFYGLGDSVSPQEKLSPRQKDIVRGTYKELIKGMGGEVLVENRTMTGDAVVTEYTVSTTDTGCGDVGLVFDDDTIKFVANAAALVSPIKSKEALAQVKSVYSSNPDNIPTIQVDGFIAQVNLGGQKETLSQARANTIKQTLVEMGMPADKISATGKGFGPHGIPSQDRMVKITISRENADCE